MSAQRLSQQLTQQASFLISRTTTQLILKSQKMPVMSHLMRPRRQSRTQLLLIRAVLTLPCALRCWSHRLWRLALECQLARPLHSSTSFASWPPSFAPQNEQVTLLASNVADILDKTLDVLRERLDVLQKARSLPWKRRASCQTGPCQWLQHLWAQAPRDDRLKATLPARVLAALNLRACGKNLVLLASKGTCGMASAG